MRRRNLDYIIIAAMLLSGLYTATTGVVMDLLDLPLLALHHYAGYACAILAGIHLFFNWKKVEAFLGRRG
jgi:hypothetical protein